jgi:hypothetical protein
MRLVKGVTLCTGIWVAAHGQEWHFVNRELKAVSPSALRILVPAGYEKK